jgi:5-methylthioadenosine/S-adenosylhomocysteine deaminase
VLIAGNVRKWRGRLVGHDIDRIRTLVHESRERLFGRRGLKVDILG